MRLAYFHCFSGISGDMVLGALIDAGADVDEIREGLGGLGSFELETHVVDVAGIRATKVEVLAPAEPPERSYADVRELLDRSGLPDDARALAHEVFRRLALAEARIHGVEADQVTFHEVGAVDSIVDVAGSALALHLLGVDRVVSSPVATGVGHGGPDGFPVPAPAVVELLRDARIHSRDTEAELTTPTGAAILSATAQAYGAIPLMRLEAVGYGAGSRMLDHPNVLRVLVGEALPLAEASDEALVLVETNIDDLNPELYPHVLDRLRAAGARDAWLTPVVMKKGRPGVVVSTLCFVDRQSAVEDVLFRETGTLGVRSHVVARHVLDREIVKVETSHGPVAVKVGRHGEDIVAIAPEYEDCSRIAGEAGIPAKDVYDEALRLAQAELERAPETEE